jgi:hypothetical protein
VEETDNITRIRKTTTLAGFAEFKAKDFRRKELSLLVKC